LCRAKAQDSINNINGAVKKLPQQKNRPDVKSERFFGIINYATK